MITNIDCVNLCAAIYAGVPTDWDHYDPGDAGDRVCWGIKRIGNEAAVVFRGSITLIDWLRDLMAVANPFSHDDIGPVHPGFLSGMRTVQRELGGLIDKKTPLTITGHSLGAGRAGILAGLMVTDGWTPAARIVFGEPKPGFMQLADILRAVPINRSYRNGGDLHHDLVTDVPFSAPPEEFVHPTPVIPLCAEPTGDWFSRMGVFAWHHVQLYQQGVGALKGD